MSPLMDKAPKTPWYQIGGYITGIGVAGVLVFAGIIAGSEPTSTPVQPSIAGAATVQQVAPPSTEYHIQPQVKAQPKPQPKAVPLSNDNYYTNVDGNEVHSPAYAPSVPAGASARCRDGTYSFSQNRRGTCSHHGGVAQWL